jgi:hypothetical protein
MSTAKFDTLQNAAGSVSVPVNTVVNGSAKAWVNFNGTTSPGTIRASFNVSSVTKNGTGSYTVNFTTALPDANYAVSGSSSTNDASNGFFQGPGNTGRATTGVTVFSLSTVGNLFDPQALSVAIFR